MNQNTRTYRRHNLSTQVIKGAAVPKDAYKTSAMGVSLRLVEFPSSKGRHVNSGAERKASGRKPWLGAIKQRPKSLAKVDAAVEAAAE